ncbi:DUF4410 domain-containing protein [candidate division KSB1 bacterium]|nr:DUF4410 domain-containing protein [candidate division KSB1 bacterium]
MKKIVLALLLLSLIGCGAHRMTPVENISHKDFQMIEDKDAGMVYLSPGFDFKGYETLIISGLPISPNIPKTDIDLEELNIYFIKQLIKNMNNTGLFTKVTDDTAAISDPNKQTGKTLVLESSLSELEPGNRALRYFVGFGAGAAKAQVEIDIRAPETKKILYKSSDRRVGFMGGFGGDSKDFLINFLNLIAEGQASFMKRISTGGKIEKAQ